MNQNKTTQTLLFVLSNVAYLFAFIGVCSSIGYAQDLLMLVNGLFFIFYILNLWLTGIDTFDFYDKKYFIADMISVAVYAVIPAMYFRQFAVKEFVCLSLIVISINEAVCVIWDVLCHNKADNAQGKSFHLKWVIFTTIGITINVIFLLLIILSKTFQQYIWLFISDLICISFQIIMLFAWLCAEHRLLNKQHN